MGKNDCNFLDYKEGIMGDIAEYLKYNYTHGGRTTKTPSDATWLG